MSERTVRLKNTAIAIVVAPLSTALLFGLIVFVQASDDLRVLFAWFGAIVFYGLALAVALLLLLPVHLGLGQRTLSIWLHALIGGGISVGLFVAYSVFTGDFGPPREWLWIPLYGAVLGASFAALIHRGDLRD